MEFGAVPEKYFLTPDENVRTLENDARGPNFKNRGV